MKAIATSFLLSLFFILMGQAQLRAQPAAHVADIQLPSGHFSDPELLEQDKADLALLEKAEDLIKATPSGDTIYISMFKFDEYFLAERLVKAQRRGVVVNLILDNGKTSKETNEKVRTYLTGKLNKAYFLRNDISKKAIFHNKFMLFSQVLTQDGLRSHLVLQTSTNFQKKDADKFQDMLLVHHDELYAGYRDYWLNIERLSKTGSFEDYDFHELFTSDKHYRVFFLPMRRDEKKFGEDIVVQLLDKVQDPSSVHMRIAMAKWDEGREALIDRIDQLAKNGALIEILLDKNVEDDVKDQLKDIEELVLIKLKKKKIRLHAKFFLLEGDFNGERRKFVFTGSQNFTGRSLRKNFEIFLAIEKEEIYRQYLEGFNQLRHFNPN